jgi:HlyD family secretion protein
VEVGSELSGTVRQVEVDYNDRVKKGQVLARLDTSKLEAQLLQSQASLQAAEAKVLEAQATRKESGSQLARLKHLRQLSSGKAVSEHDLEAAEAALARAAADEANCRAEVARARAALEGNQTDLSKALVRSPFDGIVLSRSVEPGQTVAATMETPVLFILAEDLTQMKLLVDVDEADVGSVQEGQEAAFTVDAYPERRFPAHITQVRYGSEEEDGVVTYKAVLNVDNSDMSLRPGMTATAEITVKRYENAMLVPNAALRFTPSENEKKSGGSSGSIMSRLLPRPPQPASGKVQRANGDVRKARVWTLRDGRPHEVPVTPGETDGSHTVIREGGVEPSMLLVVDAASVKQ